MWTTLLLSLLACAEASPGLGEISEAQPTLPTVTLQVGAKAVVAEVADSPEEREAGLMFRTKLPADQGMLFVYPDSAPRSFWMKNTVLPLSIAYIDAAGTIVRISDMTPLNLSPVPSGKPAMYCLEMSQGWFAAHHVAEGQVLRGLPAHP